MTDSTGTEFAKYRLAITTVLPVQYNAPFFRELAAHSEVELKVLYATLLGAEEALDTELGINIRWDTPLLDGYDYEVVGSVRESQATTGWRLFSPQVYKALAHGNFDAVMVMGWGSWFDRSALAAACVHRIPYFVTGDATPIFPEKPVKGALKHLSIGVIARRAAACLYVGTLQRIYFERLGVSSERLFFHPWTIDNARFSSAAEEATDRRDEIRECLGLPVDLPLIVFVGKLVPRKRPADLLDAVHKLQAGGINCGLVYVGTGELMESLKAQAKNDAIDHVYFPGFLNQRALPELLAACDIFSLPSDFDPRGTVTNEAMACGLPVVISHRVGVWGFGDLVESGVTGMIHYAGDVESLAWDCLAPLLRDEGLREKMGRAAAARLSTWGMRERVDGVIAALHSLGPPRSTKG